MATNKNAFTNKTATATVCALLDQFITDEMIAEVTDKPAHDLREKFAHMAEVAARPANKQPSKVACENKALAKQIANILAEETELNGMTWEQISDYVPAVTNASKMSAIARASEALTTYKDNKTGKTYYTLAA